MRILVVDDEPRLRSALGRTLTLEGYEVGLARDAEEALRMLRVETFDTVVLDVLMPGVDGLEVCRRLRAAEDDVPVLLLTVRDSGDEIVAGLDAGADDYLTKPFYVPELLARVRALLRRRSTAAKAILRFADVTLDPATREVHRARRSISLTRTEFRFLELLLRHPRQVLTREVILQDVWGYDPGLRSNSLEVYIGYLRRKLEACGEPRVIHTVRGIGYVLREE